ncbi:MAG: phenylacetate--CoA ligase family protein [Gemmatimonadota bacterium]
MHRTSGTTGSHLRWLDTQESWSRMVEDRMHSLRSAGVSAADRVFVAFSFGPFLGFWLIFEAATRLGCLTVPGGGLESRTRVDVILQNDTTVLCSTPTYALRLAEVAKEAGHDLGNPGRRSVAKIVVGGEPGGSVPAVRRQIEARWPGVRVYDLHGMTEVGPITYQTPISADYVHVLESSYLCEIVDPETGGPLAGDADAVGELVVTTLGRTGSPLLRYRTGDLVRPSKPLDTDPDQVSLKLRGGVLGRTDDMVVVRGVNLYPSAVEQVVRSQQGITEYQVEIGTVDGLTEVEIKIEPRANAGDAGRLARTLEQAFRSTFNLRVPVTVASPGQLPRFEHKAKRWVRK